MGLAGPSWGPGGGFLALGFASQLAIPPIAHPNLLVLALLAGSGPVGTHFQERPTGTRRARSPACPWDWGGTDPDHLSPACPQPAGYPPAAPGRVPTASPSCALFKAVERLLGGGVLRS